MDPDYLQAIIYLAGISSLVGIYIKGKIRFSDWLDKRYGLWKSTAIYNAVTLASVAAVMLLVKL